MARTLFLRAALTLVFVLLAAAPASAITYGQPDGKLHPNVGALVDTFQGTQYAYCSGTLISPTVFLTAAHCGGGSNRVRVSFDATINNKSKVYSGTFYADPRYTWAQDDPHDIAVVVFDAPIRSIAPARLPAAGSLGALSVGHPFTTVGYGGQEVVNQPGGHVIRYLDTREYSTSSLNSVNPAWLRLSQNPATGDAGACYGDSGGPNFLGAGAGATDIIGGTTITGDVWCKATNVIYRVDTEAARSFLGGFVSLP